MTLYLGEWRANIHLVLHRCRVLSTRHFILCQHNEVWSVIPMLQGREVGSEKGRELLKAHMASKGQSWNSNSSSFSPSRRLSPPRAAVHCEGAGLPPCLPPPLNS